ncbi:aminotransferase class IV [Actinoplanes teichomyceticus]|uniref:Branched-subunit amino acid aminotransferase/4-amino-4-deoxychorismate lyase n=1 Tax=Actinoplanes teichomyceticus TaxID=1867 RepID=A0A561WBK3_ACTTI|nr:aminotransferase class IV [Actinoplanes teichomyceticus]TWG21256.1 branched-subunit amino acid aminotransferase/4-amino-4-deoxychorismate lyase [Actinoplanes teichomyceticus]GIF16731.1 hypothetical protein Ate01nite_67630 [Actinoplanes teichomyceticus]
MPPATRSAPLLLWETGGNHQVEDGPYRPVVADSWLLVNGRARGYPRHWRRFAASVEECGVAPERVAQFRAAVTEALPRTGSWFPRLELHAGPPQRLALRLRPVPALSERATAWVWPGPDPRRRPRIKGPDFPDQERIRQAAREHGADEALLRDESGRVREGAFSTVWWWHDDVLHTPAADGRILPGVTRDLLLRRCQALGVPVRHRCAYLPELLDSEVWITSALHGIRQVTHIDGRPTAAADQDRLRDWRAHLDALMEPVPDPEAIRPPRFNEETQ